MVPDLRKAGLALHQTVRQPDRVGHAVRRLVAGVAEHQALVAGAELAVGMDDALVDLDRLVVEAHLHFALVGVDAGIGIAVAGVPQHLAGDAPGAVADVVKIAGSAVRNSPAMTIRLSATRVSQATLALGSRSRKASRMASEIWSASLSGWPSETDSNRR
jgi:hypothetical protein